MIEFLETKAKEDKDWEEAKAFVLGEKRGKVWVPKKEEIKPFDDDDETVSTEWDEVLANATEAEIVDLAAILGFYGMLNQVQYHSAFVSGGKASDGAEGVGFSGVAKAEELKLFEDEPPNDTDVEATLEQLKGNDSALTEVNLNNIKNISVERLVEFAEALAANTNLKKLHLANTRATDKVAKALATSIKENTTLETLNVESNYISGKAIVALLQAVNEKQTLTELRVANQRPSILGHQVERSITELMKENKTLKRLGIFLDTADAKVQVNTFLKRNNDTVRQTRVGPGGNTP